LEEEDEAKNERKLTAGSPEELRRPVSGELVAGKGQILDQFVNWTGYSPKHAICLLSNVVIPAG
jgi:hypothetical protein